MEKLNELLNQALGKNNENYINKEGMKKCKDVLEKLSKTDEPALALFLYLYPIFSPLIEEEKFWFIKFKNDNVYDEYDFALDFLNCYIKYKSHKDKKTFESDIISKISSFKNYKLIGSLFSEVKNSDEKIKATISYITKDPTFFHGTYELMTPPENIQTASFILDIKKYIEHKRALLNLEKCLKMVQLYSDKLQKTEILNQNLITEKTNLRKDNEKFLSRLNQLESEYKNLKNDNNIMKTNINNLTNENNSMKTNINTMETKINNLTNENNTMKTNINNLQTDNNILQAKVNSLENENEKLKQNEIVTQSNIQNIIENNNSLSQKVEDMTKRLEKIDLRDTIKMSFRYLYKVLKSNFPN